MLLGRAVRNSTRKFVSDLDSQQRVHDKFFYIYINNKKKEPRRCFSLVSYLHSIKQKESRRVKGKYMVKKKEKSLAYNKFPLLFIYLFKISLYSATMIYGD